VRGKVEQDSCRGDGNLPPRFCFGPKGSQRGSGDEVALEVEVVVDSGMDTEEALRISRRFEPLHPALPSSHGLMGVLSAIVLSEPLIVMAG
jgi:hypothetical protein